MPSSDTGLEMLVRSSPLTEVEWLELIELRRQRIKPILKSFALEKLGVWWNARTMSERNYKWTANTTPVFGDARFSLETRGFFRKQPDEAVEKDDSGEVVKMWGLTRSSVWILATADVVNVELDRKLVRHFTIADADVATIVQAAKVPPQGIWEALGEAVASFAHARKCLYDEAVALERRFIAERAIVDVLYQRLRKYHI